MIRNIDIVAVALLLIGIAIYTHVRGFAYVIANENGFHLRPKMRTVVIPPPPPPPHIWTLRD